MPELEVGLAVGAWSMDTDAGDKRGSGSPPASDGTVASLCGMSTAAGVALPVGVATERTASHLCQRMENIGTVASSQKAGAALMRMLHQRRCCCGRAQRIQNEAVQRCHDRCGTSAGRRLASAEDQDICKI